MSKSILFVATRFPYPPHSGERLRVFSILRELAKAHHVSLLVLSNEKDEQVAALKRETGINEVVTIRQSRGQRVIGLLKALLGATPLQVGYFHAPAMLCWVVKNSARFDIGIFHLLRGAQYAVAFAGRRKVIEMCDANSETFRQNALITRWYQPWHWVCRLEAPRALAAERAAVRHFDLVTLHTRYDAEIISVTQERILISTQGVDIRSYPFTPPSARPRNALVFIGKMDFHPNFDAMDWFIEQVLPRLPAEVTLKIIGVCPPAQAVRLQRNPRVHITGRVDSIAQAAADGSIGIAPIRSATGVQNKVLESFALGLPVVTTANVLKGLLPGSESCLLIAESPDDWVASIRRLSEDALLRDSIAHAGRAYVETRHDWNRIGDEYLSALDSLDIKEHSLS